MKTMIISAFSACGKTYLTENQEELKFNYLGKIRKFSFLDSDSSAYEKVDGWEKTYVDDIEKKIGTVDFIFITQYHTVLDEIKKRNLSFVMVFPNNIWGTDYEKKLTKQQWFGRIALRDNSFIRGDFKSWIEHLSWKYDNWINMDTIEKYNPVTFFVLNRDQYLSSIVEDLYWKKEHYPNIYCLNISGSVKI